MQTDEVEKLYVSQKLSGKSFVISGTFSGYSRDEIKQLIEINGGRIIASVSSNADFLLAGQNMGPEKLKKAEKLNVQIISEDEFIALIK